VDIGAVIGLVIGLTGLAGTVFTALRWRRDDTSAAVSTQSTVLGDMAGLNDELRKAVTDCRTDRDRLAGENEAMRRELRRQLPPGNER